MAKSEETKIADCPCGDCDACRCDLLPFDKEGFPRRYYVSCCWCEFRSPLRSTEVEAIAAHNALCADIECGKLAAEAIALLKKWHTNCLCVHLYLGTRQPTGILLALPAVAEIIAEQKKDGERRLEMMKTNYVVIRFELQPNGEWFCFSNERQTKIGTVQWHGKKRAWLYYANQKVKIGMPAFVVKDIYRFVETLLPEAPDA